MTALNRSASPHRRQGFTLVEVLVAMALIIFIMVILTEAFTAGIGVFRNLKAAGDMQEKLRAAESLLRDDLVHYHFDGTNRLSNLDTTNPPTQGYFFIQQSGSSTEGSDGLSTLYRMWTGPVPPAAPPVLCFTVNYNKPPNVSPALADKGYLPGDFFTARIPQNPGNPTVTIISPTGPEQALIKPTNPPASTGGPVDYVPPQDTLNGYFASQWAEVGYFLVATGRQAGSTAGNQMPLYSLRRRTRAIVSDTTFSGPSGSLNTTSRIPATSATTNDMFNARYAEMSCVPDSTGNLYFNSPADLATQATNRMYSMQSGSLPTVLGTTQGQLAWAGDDLVITDVISFNVRVLYTPSATVTDFANLGASGTAVSYVADATTQTQVRALEITIRVWDVKTNLARQITIVQDM